MKNLVLLIFFLRFSVSAASAHEASISFKSPDGNSRIDEIIHSTESKELAFARAGDKSSKPFYTFRRTANVLWSPDNRLFAVNDNAGSNISSALIFSVTNLSKPSREKSFSKAREELLFSLKR